MLLLYLITVSNLSRVLSEESSMHKSKLLNETSVVCSYQLKEASVKDARATPPTIGTREETTQRVGLCVHRMVKTQNYK